MNPFPLVLAGLRRNAFASGLFVALIAVAVALGIAISAQERALRQGSARAADRFDLVVAAPGSQTDILFAAVYLSPRSSELLSAEMTARVLNDPDAAFAAPIGFGDSVDGMPVVGTTAAFVEHLSGGLAEGRAFGALDEAVLGALVDLPVGGAIGIDHGDADAIDADSAGEEDHDHDHDHGHDHPHDHDHGAVRAVGRMAPTGTPWDRAVIVPIEFTWAAHGLPPGHAEGDTHLGAPFAAPPGVPAVIVQPKSLLDAYGLRARYRTPDSTAFFPAEVLVSLYDIMGDVARVMGALTLAAQAMVVAAILVGLMALLDLQRRRFAVLRALGAPARFVFAVVWCQTAALILAGAVIGLPLGWLVAEAAAGAVARQTGVAMAARIGARELAWIAALLGLGLLLAVIPAALVRRRPVLDSLR